MVYPIAKEQFCVYNGDTVTVLGILTYDPKFDSYEILNPISLFLGDRHDYLKILESKSDSSWSKFIFLSSISLVSGFLAYYCYNKQERIQQ